MAKSKFIVAGIVFVLLLLLIAIGQMEDAPLSDANGIPSASPTGLDGASASPNDTTPQQNEVSDEGQIDATHTRARLSKKDEAGNAGYDDGYWQGLQDGEHGYSRNAYFDRSNNEEAFPDYITEYREAYNEGYDVGYDEGVRRYQDEQERKRKEEIHFIGYIE